MPATAAQREAARLFHLAFRLHMQGEVERAAHQYCRSLELAPSAEAHTLLAWARSHQGRFEDAISECRKAIALDPDLGNPYNDLGAYLIELGRPSDAIPWLVRALQAPRYEAYCYPHYHLGRANEMLGDRVEARRQYGNAVEADPTFVPARLALQRLEGRDHSPGGG
jgi:Tfp pilus assembly protein PilF